VLGVPIDTQSYIKSIISMHYDRAQMSSGQAPMRPWGKDNLAYLYALFENDVPREDYALAGVLLQEYVNTVTDEQFNGRNQRQSSKERRKSKRSSKEKSGRGSKSSRRSSEEVDWKTIE